ncbi:MAG: response regulator transcription factor [Thermoflexales bacterium]|nr:response regulator transcription factor [Thermoflexales bacterium]
MIKTKLLIIDDRESVRQALEARLGKAPEIELVGSTGSSQEGLKLVGEKKPDVVLLEVKIADGSGLETCRQIVAGGASVIILTSYLDEAERQAAFEAGASRYVLKNIDSERLIKAIQAVRSDQRRG